MSRIDQILDNAVKQRFADSSEIKKYLELFGLTVTIGNSLKHSKSEHITHIHNSLFNGLLGRDYWTFNNVDKEKTYVLAGIVGNTYRLDFSFSPDKQNINIHLIDSYTGNVIVTNHLRHVHGFTIKYFLEFFYNDLDNELQNLRYQHENRD